MSAGTDPKNSTSLHTYQTREATTDWQPCKAKCLAGAKAAAQRRQSFQGTALSVGIRDNSSGKITVIAQKRPIDAIDMNAHSAWCAVQNEEYPS